jgi:glutaredoxin
MRATLTGALLLGLLVLLVLLAQGEIERERKSSSAAAAAMTTPPPTPAREPAPTAAAHVEVISAGELSVLEDDAPEPMVRYFDAGGSLRMVRGLDRVPAERRTSAVVVGRDHVNLVNVPAPSAVAFQDWQPAPNPNRSEVVLFSAPWCGVCERAKRYLDQRGVRYEERDIEDDDEAREEVVRVLGQVAIPLLEVDGRYISGFEPGVYDRALR